MTRQTPSQALSEGRKWVEDNPKAYKRLRKLAKHHAKEHPGRDVRISAFVEMVRSDMHVSVPNAVRAYLARRIEKELRSVGIAVRFTRSKSKIDTLIEVEQ